MIHDSIYAAPSIGFLLVLFIGWYIASQFRYRAYLAKLGGKPRLVPYYLPFGLDSLWLGIKVSPSRHVLRQNNAANKNFEYLRDNVENWGPTHMVILSGTNITPVTRTRGNADHHGRPREHQGYSCDAIS
jgi:hypothetical protein